MEFSPFFIIITVMHSTLKQFIEHWNLLDLLPDYVFLKNERGVYLEANQNYLDLIGVTREELIGKTDYDLFSRDIAKIYQENDKDILTTGETFVGGETQDLRDGTTRRIETRKKPLFDKKGRVVGILGIFRDVSAEQRERERHLLLKDSIVESFSGAVFLFDDERRCMYQNRQAVKLFGNTYIESAEKMDHVLADMRRRVQGTIPDASLLDTVEYVDIGELAHPETRMFLKGYMARVRDLEGKGKGFSIVLNDVTDQKRNELRYRQLIEDANSIILQIDTRGHIIYMNNAAKKTFGVEADELIGKKMVGTIVDDLDTDIHERILHEPDKYLQNENYNITRSGKKIWVAWTNRVLYDALGEPEGILCIGNDITAVKETEKELRKAKFAAENANRMKDQFLANMSHELRTPMSGIMATVDMLRKAGPSEEQLQLIELLSLSAVRLKDIITDVLDFTMAAAGQLVLKETFFSFKDLLHEVAGEYRHWVEEKGIGFETELVEGFPEKIELDRVWTKKIIQNLLANSVSFTEKGTIRLEASIETTSGTGCTLIVVVKDTGTGIPEEALDDIFEPFLQLEETYSKEHRGIGLGLTMVKALVDLMKGNLQVKSKPGEGSVFTVRLPARLEAGKKEDNRTSHGGHPLRVLIAEDESINRMYLETVIKKQGYFYKGVKNGLEVLELLEKERFDVILMDIGMPRLNGLDATVRIRQYEQPTIARIPVIALTAHTGRQDRIAAEEAGMNGFVGKPYLEKDIVDEIDRVMQARYNGAIKGD